MSLLHKVCTKILRRITIMQFTQYDFISYGLSQSVCTVFTTLVKLLGVEKCDRTSVCKSRPSLKQSRITKMLTFKRLEGHSLAFRGNKGQVFRR